MQRARGTGPRATGQEEKKRGGQAPALRSLKRSRGTGPRATKPRTAPLTVGRGPVPRHAALIERSRGTGPRATGQEEKKARGTGPRTTVIERSRGTGPRTTKPRTAIFAVSTHQTLSTSDLPQRRDRATYASPRSQAYHQTQLLRSDSNTPHPASQTYP